MAIDKGIKSVNDFVHSKKTIPVGIKSMKISNPVSVIVVRNNGITMAGSKSIFSFRAHTVDLGLFSLFKVQPLDIKKERHITHALFYLPRVTFCI